MFGRRGENDAPYIYFTSRLLVEKQKTLRSQAAPIGQATDLTSGAFRKILSPLSVQDRNHERFEQFFKQQALVLKLVLDCKQSLIFLCKVTARETHARELQ